MKGTALCRIRQQVAVGDERECALLLFHVWNLLSWL
jgi:hypothetical protein